MKYDIHPLFKKNEAYFDIAVVETTPIKTSDIIRPICLPLSENNYDNNGITLTGCGAQVNFGPASPKLQRVVLNVFPQWYVFLSSFETLFFIL